MNIIIPESNDPLESLVIIEYYWPYILKRLALQPHPENIESINELISQWADEQRTLTILDQVNTDYSPQFITSSLFEQIPINPSLAIARSLVVNDTELAVLLKLKNRCNLEHITALSVSISQSPHTFLETLRSNTFGTLQTLHIDSYNAHSLDFSDLPSCRSLQTLTIETTDCESLWHMLDVGLPKLHTMILHYTDNNGDFLANLMNSNRFPELKHLTILNDGNSPARVRNILKTQGLHTRLKSLAIEVEHPFYIDDFDALCSSDTLSSLKHLTLRNRCNNDTNDTQAAFRSLAHRHFACQLETLVLGNVIGKENIADRVWSAFPALKSLSLGHNDLNSSQIEGIFNANLSLKFLNISGSNIGNLAAQKIAKSKQSSSLEKLWLNNTDLDSKGLCLLLSSKHLTKLKSLEIGNNLLGAETQSIWLQPHSMNSLHRLSIGGNPLGDQAITNLIQSPYFQSLQHLSISDTHLTDRVGLAISKTHEIQRFISLNTYGNRLTTNTQEALQSALNQKHMPPPLT